MKKLLPLLFSAIVILFLYRSSTLMPVENAFKQHSGDPGYSYARFKVATGAVHTLRADSLFKAIAYGMANGESIGYKVGFKYR